jgi:hypothetical protein
LFLLASIGRRWMIRRKFSDDDGRGCLAEWCGRYHPECRGLDDPGREFLRFIGLPEVSEVVFSWDRGDQAFRKELREAIRAELKLRRVRDGQPVDVLV